MKEEGWRERSVLESTVKLLTIVFLLSFSAMLISIFQIQLREYDFYLHFLYLPIVLSTFWWGKKGSVSALALGAFLIYSAIVRNVPQKEIFSYSIGAIMFFIVSLVVGILSDEKNDALKGEMQFKMDTAHYFFNPLCIAEGNIDLALKYAADGEMKEELEAAQKAVQRIKRVVRNVVEKGEVHE
jgi:thiamine transporter ThiT